MRSRWPGLALLVGASLASAPCDFARGADFKILYSFDTSEAFGPQGLASDKAGNLYGTLCCGGEFGYGAIYRLTPDGERTILYSFRNAEDGGIAEPGLARDKNGDLYGTTGIGGNNEGGTAFRLGADGAFETIHAFGAAGDGSVPDGYLIRDGAGNLFGATYAGGAKDAGTIFRLSPHGHETILYSFSRKLGSHPIGGLLRDSDGGLFGTAFDGGASDRCRKGCGVAFRLSPDGQLTVLHQFAGGDSDAAAPVSNLVMDEDGNLYGGAKYGGGFGCGGSGCGAIFKLAPDGAEQVLHAFAGDADGAEPDALVIDKKGRLFGAAFLGGGGCAKDGCGTILEIEPDGAAIVLHAFTGGDDGAKPNGLILGKKGMLLGTAEVGGAGGGGAAFSIKP